MQRTQLNSQEGTGNPNSETLVRDYKSIKEDYQYNSDIFTQDEERVAKVKYIIDNILSPADKIIILLYADCGSLRKLGQRMGMSHMTLQKQVVRIKNIIINEYGKL